MHLKSLVLSQATGSNQLSASALEHDLFTNSEAAVAAAAMLCLIIFIPATDFGNAKNSDLPRFFGAWSTGGTLEII